MCSNLSRLAALCLCQASLELLWPLLDALSDLFLYTGLFYFIPLCFWCYLFLIISDLQEFISVTIFTSLKKLSLTGYIGSMLRKETVGFHLPSPVWKLVLPALKNIFENPAQNRSSPEIHPLELISVYGFTPWIGHRTFCKLNMDKNWC